MELLEVVSVLISLVSLYPQGQVAGVALPPLMSWVYISHKANVALIKLVLWLDGRALQSFLANCIQIFEFVFFFFFILLFMGAGKHSEISLDKPQQLEDTGFSMEWRNFIRGAIVPLCSQHFGNCSLD